jgi:hypothetical protein
VKSLQQGRLARLVSTDESGDSFERIQPLSSMFRKFWTRYRTAFSIKTSLSGVSDRLNAGCPPGTQATLECAGGCAVAEALAYRPISLRSYSLTNVGAEGGIRSDHFSNKLMARDVRH